MQWTPLLSFFSWENAKILVSIILFDHMQFEYQVYDFPDRKDSAKLQLARK